MRAPIRAAGAFALLAVLACGAGETEPATVTVATADGMCAEHGVLMAVCTKHNPALIPVFQAKGDWCAAHGLPMSFCPVHHPERGGRPVGVVADDGAPADGTKIRFRTRDAASAAGIATVAAVPSAEEGGVEAVARLTWDGTRHAVVGARAPGVVERLVADVGSRVQAGDPLVVVASATARADRSSAGAARSRLAVAEQAVARKEGLGDGVSAAELAAARQEVAAARAELAGRESEVGYTLTSPIAGVVLAREVTLGAAVAAGAPMFEIVDPSALWAEIDVPERDAAGVAPGLAVTLTFDGSPPMTGVLAYVSPAIDPTSRTLGARVAVPNPDGVLRANVYGTARISVGGERDVVVVPTAAVQRAGGVDLVFVRLSEDSYEARRVTVVRRQGGDAHLAGGVRAGEDVATDGSFLLKTETLKDSIGAGCCDVE